MGTIIKIAYLVLGILFGFVLGFGYTVLASERSVVFQDVQLQEKEACPFNDPKEYAVCKYGQIPFFVETLQRESGFQSVQSRCTKNGVREQSFGCAQIHLPSHPEVSYEQAMDCKWSIDWAAEKFLEGEAHQWTEYRKLTAK